MPDSDSWDVIAGPASSQITLGVDFPAVRRGEANFTTLAAAIGSRYRFLQVRPRTPAMGQRVYRDAYPGQVQAVFGYGVGGVYAASIAAEISQWQPTPKVILFDPQFPSTRLLCDEFSREISAVSPLLSDDEAERARKIATEIVKQGTRSVADAAIKLAEDYLSVIAAPYERAGLGEARNSEFTLSFESYMSWISAAAEIDPSHTWTQSTAIVSSDYIEMSSGKHLSEGISDPVGSIGRWIPFGEGRADLLRSDSVIETVLDLIELEFSCPL